MKVGRRIADPFARNRWHLWFAWYPVYTIECETVWLERVWRRAIGWCDFVWEHSIRGPEREDIVTEFDWVRRP